MDIAEKVFGWSWQAKNKLFARSIRPQAFYLNSKKDHFTTLACAFFEDIIYIKESQGCGGVIGSSLFLPSYCDIFTDEKLNYQFYVYRILLDQTAVRLGFYFKFDSLSQNDFCIISLIAYRTILKELKEDYPNLVPFIQQLHETFLTSYKANAKKKSKGYFFYQIQQILVGDKRDDFSDFYSLLHRDDYNPSDLIQAGMDFKKLIKRNNFSSLEQIEMNIIFSHIPSASQILKIKKSDQSKIKEADSTKGETFKKTKSKERVTKIELDENDPDCNPASLLMEAIKTADLFSGGKKMIDGSDELSDHFNALEELNIKEITRSSTQAQSIFKADISIKLDYSDEDEEGVDKAASQFYYDEWNLQTNRYKKSWCTVNQKTIPMPLDKTEFIKYHADIINKHRSEIVELRRLFNNALYDRRPKKRQIDGGDIDIDALINAHADIKSGHTPSNKLYISKTHTPADLAVCLLLDSSLSADSYVSGRKIVDIAKESIIVIQEVIDGLFENLMIATFFSNTRKNSSYNIIKGFDENWKVVQSRLENMVPTGYTRIGTSLRHSIHELGLTKVKNKVIILISDGKPTDYDAYEGKYGIADVRQCVREAKTQNIDILSLAIDKDAKFYFPQLFGVQNYQIISGANELPTQMIKLLSKVFKCKT